MGGNRYTEILIVRVDKKTRERIEKIVREEGYNSIADYLRDLIRNDLRRRGILSSWHDKP
ncbi:ribbon-helix-helix protein [Pyrococcus abyssi virus 1]|uniref:ribbon-helix-helix protein n=1 Tax=Pyrococcus abyssi virus 1 TaxID=425386 RepID=UPI00015529AE|nr:ribbon-helix-helix protein [Pyrococcus abyssi virus 1]ABN58485.1 ribbon-helix-helix protein [Pyrococcus abyssi virus 1]